MFLTTLPRWWQEHSTSSTWSSSTTARRPTPAPRRPGRRRDAGWRCTTSPGNSRGRSQTLLVSETKLFLKYIGFNILISAPRSYVVFITNVHGYYGLHGSNTLYTLNTAVRVQTLVEPSLVSQLILIFYYQTPWRIGSASDSRSEGCVFESRRGQKDFVRVNSAN